MERFVSFGQRTITKTPEHIRKMGLRFTQAPSNIEKKSLGELNTLYLEEEVNDSSIQRLIASFREINKNAPNQEITLRINSDGGYIASVLKMITQMQHLSNPIETITETNAYSSAALILASGTPDRRYAYEGARIMIHQSQIKISNWEGSMPALIEYCNEKKKSNDLFLGALAHATGRSFEKIESDTREDLNLTAEEAVNYGIIDHVIPRPERLAKSATLLSLNHEG